jgi:hypothetical protein
MKMLALLGTPIAIFAITEFYALKMNDWQFDPFETGLAFVVALFLLIAAPLILLITHVTRATQELIYALVEGSAICLGLTFWLLLCFLLIRAAYRRQNKPDQSIPGFIGKFTRKH